jgi:hypothetical protein
LLDRFDSNAGSFFVNEALRKACCDVAQPFILLALALAFVFNSESLAQAEKPKLSVSSFELDTLSLKPPSSKEIATGLNPLGEEPWCAAAPVETNGAWNEVPREAKPSQWVSVVTTGFNEQADAYAFMFDGPEGAMSMAAHLPFRQTRLEGGTLAWIWPFSGMYGTIRVHHDALAKPVEREPLALKIVPWEGAETAAVKKTNRSTRKVSSLDEARTLDPEQVFTPVSVMVQAAAFEAGWAPTQGKANWSGTCEIRVEDSSCSFRLKLTGPAGEETFIKEYVPWETYHDHLVRIFRYVHHKIGVSDITQLARGQAELLAIEEGRLACLLDKELTVFDLKSGQKLWTTAPPIKAPNYRPIDRYTALLSDQGQWQLLQYGRQLSELDWATGNITVLAPIAADSPAHVAAGKSQEWAGMALGTLQFAQQNEIAWEHEQLNRLTAGPLVEGKAVLVGDATGLLVARAKADGKLRWQQKLPARLYGSIVADRDQLLVFSNETESLLALDTTTGKQRWECPTGDVLLQAPIVLGQQLLVVTKGNRLLLVDRTKGTILQQSQWPTWIVSVAVATEQSPPLLGVSDLAGEVTLLLLDSLKPVRKIPIEVELAGPLLFAADMPLHWPVVKPNKKVSEEVEENLLTEIKQGPVRTGPAWLVTDTTGFLYILPQATKE